ncbi:MAG: sodium:solute symporter [Candidatus Aminicenantales bacterium]
MTALDWAILAIYIVGIIGMSWAIGRRQKSQNDYYLGGRAMPAWQIALSIMATQVSAISLIGAPAFIALRANGGLVWLQYEFAIPLAMMLIMLILVPMYHRAHGVTIYEYLERRFGAATRSTISAVFLISRGLGSGVALLATGIVTAVCLNWPLWETVLLIGVVSIVYTTFGGIKADIYSDIIQLVILWTGAFISLFILWNKLDGRAFSVLTQDSSRFRVFNFSASGLGDGQTFAFWPMLIGGFFLYLSYYGCDQSQAQRLLTTRTFHQAQKALFLNGLLRFPLVLTYCAVGVLLLPFLHTHPEFAGQLDGRPPDFLIPYFLIQYIPKGLLGILIAGIFAASMSTLDSALNSLSAATYRDFLVKIRPGLDALSNRKQVRLSRLLTIFWGIISTAFALKMIGGSETVLELVNKIGSAFYGPVLAVFWLGMWVRRASEKGAITGLAAGVAVNIFLWQYFGERVSWLWWNVVGFGVSFGFGLASCLISSVRPGEATLPYLLTRKDLRTFLGRKKYYIWLFLFFLAILLLSKGIEFFLRNRAGI